MFGLSKKTENDKLGVQVHVVSSAEVFATVGKLWAENSRTLRLDQASGKEFLHFAYAHPPCVIWLQRDSGRTDVFELIVRWENTKTYELFVLGSGPTAGNDQRAKALLQSMLTTPSVVLSANN